MRLIAQYLADVLVTAGRASYVVSWYSVFTAYKYFHLFHFQVKEKLQKMSKEGVVRFTTVN